MPNSPKWERPYWMPKQEKQKEPDHSNQKEYESSWWRKYRKNYIKNISRGLCEVEKALGKIYDVTLKKRDAYLDHIIRINAGGSLKDPRNHMLMRAYWHNKKRGLEGKKSILIETIKNKDGELIPKNRMDIIAVLTK